MKNISSILSMWLFKKTVSGWNFVWAFQKVRRLRIALCKWSGSNQQYKQDKATQVKIETLHENGLWQRWNKSTQLVNILMQHGSQQPLGKENTSGTSSFLSTGQDWANKRDSGSDGGDRQQWPLRDALLSALIVAMIIICGRNCREAVRAYLQLSQKRTHSY